MRVKLTVLGIVLLGFTLRLWTIGNGIPHTTGTDEPVIMEKAVQIMRSGDLNPHFFDYGGLTIYLQMAVASLRFAAGALSREWTSLDRVWEGDFYLWARTTTALLGTFLIYVVYRIGLRWNIAVALIAALMMAIHPHLVRESHYALTDTPLTFLLALTLLLSLVAAEDGRLRWFLLAGVTAGLATATKYNGSLGLLLPLCAAVSPTVRLRTAAMVTAGLGLVGGFLVTSPYSLLDLPEFLNAFALLAQHYNQPGSAMEGAEIYIKHIRLGFGLGLAGRWSALLGLPAVVFCLVGLVSLFSQLFSRARRAQALILLVFPLVYFWMIAQQSLIYARYALPLAPVLCLSLAIGLTTVHQRLDATVSAPRRRRQVLVALLLVVAIPPAVQAISFDFERRKVGTEELMAQWLQKNIRPEDRIIIESPTIRLPPGFHYEYHARLIQRPVEEYRAKGVVYLVLDSGKFNEAMRSPGEVAGYRALFASTEMIKTIPKTDDHPGPTLTVLRIPKQ